MSVTYDIVHKTTYSYAFPVTLSHHVAHLILRACARQTSAYSRLEVIPGTSSRSSRMDYFGNPVTLFTVEQSHQELSVVMKSRVTVDPEPPPDPAKTPPWEAVSELLQAPTPTLRFASGGYCPLESGAMEINPTDLAEATGFLHDSPQIPLVPELRPLAEACFPPGTPILEGAMRLTTLIFHSFSYDPEATEINTPLTTVLAERRGVCQDFAHVMIGALRSLGLAARYVSGYLLTGNSLPASTSKDLEARATEKLATEKQGSERSLSAPGRAQSQEDKSGVYLQDAQTQGAQLQAANSGPGLSPEQTDATSVVPAADPMQGYDLVGADATHAWVSLWVPGLGWIDLDPTNNKFALSEHVVTACGRDFDDVSPIKGVMVGGGEHTITVEVAVRPVDGIMPQPVPQLTIQPPTGWPAAAEIPLTEGPVAQGAEGSR